MNKDSIEHIMPPERSEQIDPELVEPVSRALDQIFEYSMKRLDKDMKKLDDVLPTNASLVTLNVHLNGTSFVEAGEDSNGKRNVVLEANPDEEYKLVATIQKRSTGHEVSKYELFKKFSDSDENMDVTDQKLLSLEKRDDEDIVKISNPEDTEKIVFLLLDKASQFSEK